MKYKLVIFDWQGTLSDYIGQFAKQFCDVAVQIGLPKIENSQLRPLAHLDLCMIVQNLFPDAEYHTKRMRMVEYFKSYRMHHGHEACLYDGASDLIKKLHEDNVFIGIATAASEQTLKAELTYSGLSTLVDAYRTPDHTLGKPAPDMINELIDEFGCEKNETVMIGDSRSDFESAQHANVDFIGIHIENKHLISDILASSNLIAHDIAALTKNLG